jgi:hypothetical protein
MASDNKLELVVEVDASRANASIKSINSGLSGMEQAAASAARGASAGIDGFTASVAKGAAAGNLLAESIKKAIEWVKEWTVEAAKSAANTERMEAITASLARVHGNSAESARKAAEAIKQVGYTTDEALGAVQKMIRADMDLSRAEGLAKVAKDAAAMSAEGLSAADAMEKVLMAIESGQGRGLREIGIFVNLNNETERAQKLAQLHGKELDENEIKEVRRVAIMREAAKMQGTAAAVTGSLKAETAALGREVDELNKAIGKEFQQYLVDIVHYMRDLVGFLKENSDWIVKFAQGAIFLAGAIATYGLITKIMGITTAVEGLAAALTANPIALLITGVLASGAIVWKTWSDTQAGLERGYEDLRRQGLQKDLFSGKLKPEDVKRMGYTDAQIREIISGKRLLPGEDWGDFSDFGWPKLKIQIGGKKEPSDADLDRMLADRKKRIEAEKAAQEYYMRAVEERKAAEHEMARARIEDSMRIIETTQSETEAAKESLNVVLLSMEQHAAGIAKIREEEKREIEQLSTRVDEKSGVVRHIALSAATLEAIHKATAEKIAAFDMQFNEEESRRIQAMLTAAAERSRKLFEQLYIEPMKQQLYVWEQGREWQDKIDDQTRSARLAAVDQRKDLELARLEAVDAVTIQDKIRLEQAKTAIEVQAIKERAAIEMEQIDAQTERQVDEARKAAMAQGIFYEPYLQQIGSKIRELGQHEKDALQKATASEVDVAQTKGAAATRKVVTDEYRSIFQTLKQEAGGVFDALVTKSQSVWSAIGNSLKTALLTAIKDVVTSRVAAMLMQLFVPGANVEMRQSGMGGGGILGRLGGILGVGAVPVFASGGTPPFVPSGSAGGLGTILPQVLGPGGTPPFLPSATGAGTGAGIGATPAAGGMLSKAGLAGFLPGLKSFFGFGDNTWVNVGGGRMATGGWIGQYGSLGDKLTALGKSNAALLAGGMLLLNGLQRGGWIGMGEDVAGGAMIGFKYGGPLGAAIGAAAGAVAGIVRLFVKGATDKAKEKVKALYGVDIHDKGVLQQIVDTAKSAYGGNLDLAIRSAQVRDLIQLYAMTTGQKPKGMPGTVTPLSLVETGGSLFQAMSYSNGTPLPGLAGLPSLGQIGGGTMTNAGGTIVIPLQIDSQAIGNVVIQNGRVVTQGAITAMKSNAGRREMTALQLSPGTLVS